MPKVSSSPSPRTFSEALAREVLQKAAAEVAAEGGAHDLDGASVLAKEALDAWGAPLRTQDDQDAFVAFAKARAAAAVAQAAGGDGRLSNSDAQDLPADLRQAFHYLKTDELPGASSPRRRPRYSNAIMTSVLAAHGLTAADRTAVEDLALKLGDGNTYLNRKEITAAAAQLSAKLPALAQHIPAGWRGELKDALEDPSFAKLDAFVSSERGRTTVYPPEELTFAALDRTSLDDVKVVLLGQDPYHGPGEATGLSFSLPVGVRVPSSLNNIYKELEDDVGATRPNHGNLEDWADQGVMLLNTALTVEKDKAGSHRGKGWEELTTSILEKINEKDERVVFLLLGGDARKKASLIDTSKHTVVTAAHPSGLSAHRGFFGSKVFTQVNDALVDGGRDPVDWQIDDR